MNFISFPSKFNLKPIMVGQHSHTCVCMCACVFKRACEQDGITNLNEMEMWSSLYAKRTLFCLLIYCFRAI